MNQKDILKEKSFSFAIKAVALYKYLQEEKREFIISKQFLRSGTSVGANIREAKNAQSPKDFVHKLHIAQKECDESLYWLELMSATNYIGLQEYEKVACEASEILRIIKSSILTVKQKMK
ncbi:four helix bundle protein [Pseudopedobacter beijingensis]|uniref:Four helix bundle protein n=1 Tax=Pseudopedobacter beijingensis TaxID=1207056 RepID=A0ABW4IEC2_9SPHI